MTFTETGNNSYFLRQEKYSLNSKYSAGTIQQSQEAFGFAERSPQVIFSRPKIPCLSRHETSNKVLTIQGVETVDKTFFDQKHDYFRSIFQAV